MYVSRVPVLMAVLVVDLLSLSLPLFVALPGRLLAQALRLATPSFAPSALRQLI